MKMYKWFSIALEEVYPGHIVVMAENVEEARKKGLEHFDEQLGYHWKRDTIISDLATEPEEVEVVFVYGGT